MLDPIDGTKSFISGVPLFGTLIALARNGRPILGIIDQPISRERWIGADGRPTLFNGAPIRCRPCPSLAAATLFATSPDMFGGPTRPRSGGLPPPRSSCGSAPIATPTVCWRWG